MFFIIFITCLCAFTEVLCKITSNDEVLHLIGDPDFRDVSLRWDYDAPAGALGDSTTLHGFQIHYCEIQAWGPHRCRTKVIDPKQSITSNRRGRSGSQSFNARIGGLRMATTYSFEVRPIERDPLDLADEQSIGKSIIVPTKGFSARATQCLPDASEVEVSTGPYFGGRIAVEAADGGPEKCFIQGNPKSAQDAYILRIQHEECGSIVNETTVSTYVIVQENLPILTHSTRRFLVLCTYKPETLTVRAGLNLPNNPADNNLQYYKPQSGSVEPYDTDLGYNDLDDVRHEARVSDTTSNGISGEIGFVVFLVMASFGVIGFVIWRMVPQLSDHSESITAARGTLTRNRLFGFNMANNRDKYSDVGSVYSITLSEKDDDKRSNGGDGDNVSEA